MTAFSRVFRRRILILAVALAATLSVCVWLALVVQRDASGKLNQLAHVELEAATLARQFRSEIDDLHGALLRIGTAAAADSGAVIRQRRQKLSEWLDTQQHADNSETDRSILRKMVGETQAYFFKLDALDARTNGLSAPLDRDTVVMFDDSANRLQSIADDFAAAHDGDLRDLLAASLNSLLWMRNLIFAGLGLLLAAIGALVLLLYRDVVRPLREQLVDRNTLLAKQEKLSALGTLAAGVAHEIRNPLTAIKARLYSLRQAVAAGEGRDDLQAIATEVDRLERIVRDVLGYAHPAEAALREVDLCAWLVEFADFVRPELTAAQIDLALTAEVGSEVAVDPDQLRQIMLNLVRNAQESFAGRPGRIQLRLGRERGLFRGRRVESVILSVTDDGPGIPAGIQARLFDPFFTTKPTGTGLGLSIVARLVENLGGEVRFQSAAGTGTRFVVCLPLSSPPRQSAAG